MSPVETSPAPTTTPPTSTTTVESAPPTNTGTTPSPTPPKSEKPKTVNPLENGLGLGSFLDPLKKPAETAKPAQPKPEAKVEPPATEAKAEPKKEKVAAPKYGELEDPLKNIQEELAKKEKQLKDTRDAFTQDRQRIIDLKKEMSEARDAIKKLERLMKGEVDDLPQNPDPKVALEQERIKTKVEVSHAAAIERYGEEEVNRLIWAQDAPFREYDQDAAIQARVMNAKLPVIEAIKILKEEEAKTKWGSTPDEMDEAIRKEERTKLEKELRAEYQKKHKGPAIEPVQGLGGVRGHSVAESTKSNQALNLNTLFPNFKT